MSVDHMMFLQYIGEVALAFIKKLQNEGVQSKSGHYQYFSL